MATRMSAAALIEVERALERYEAEVNATPLKELAKTTYLLHARNFVRWLNGDFEPGARLRRK
jgi:hypothetical protein